MKLFLVNFLVFFYLTSCSNINFLVEKKEVSGFLQNKTNVYSDGWEKHYLKDALFMQLGEPFERRFLLTSKVTEKQTKRSIGDNQVAEKIDFRVVVDYTLIDSSNNCPEIKNRQISSFSYTPKSSGYNFASDVLLNNLYEKALLDNVINFISFSERELVSHNCLHEN